MIRDRHGCILVVGLRNSLATSISLLELRREGLTTISVKRIILEGDSTTVVNWIKAHNHPQSSNH